MALAAMPSPAPAVGATVKDQSLLFARTSKNLALTTALSAMPAIARLARSTSVKVPPTAVPLPLLAGASPPANWIVCTWFCALISNDWFIVWSMLISSSVTPVLTPLMTTSRVSLANSSITRSFLSKR